MKKIGPRHVKGLAGDFAKAPHDEIKFRDSPLPLFEVMIQNLLGQGEKTTFAFTMESNFLFKKFFYELAPAGNVSHTPPELSGIENKCSNNR